ncbi:MAG: site-2 protease family protein [Spirochaetes bacterium]|nr:site-2 protease family protein [Spirochaetota bacterium]
MEKIVIGIISFGVFIISGTLHEFAHGYAAKRCGDTTAQDAGRLTLNPLRHIDILGTIVLPLVAIFSHLPVIGWMKPVPINPYYFRKRERDQVIVSVAGPAANLILIVSAFIVLKLLTIPTSYPGVSWLSALIATIPNESLARSLLYLNVAVISVTFFFYLVNIILMVFNLFPFPPLDGGWVLRAVLPYKGKEIFDRVYPMGTFILWGLMIVGVIGFIFNPIISLGIHLLGNSTSMLPSLLFR